MRKYRFLSVLAFALASVTQLKAELLIGLTTQNSIISFDSATPGTVSAPVFISGLLGGDVIVGIDRRPQIGPNNGLLYGLGVSTALGGGRIYTINDVTGVASLTSTLAPDPADNVAPFPFTTISGTVFGVDFNPVPDRLRVVSNTGQNLRINVDNGLVQLDVGLSYQTGDPRFGQAPVVTGIAYANNFGGALTTTLRGLDVAATPDTLAVFSNPNGGLLQTSLLTGLDSGVQSGYDISGLTGTPYFSLTAPGAGASSLYTVSGGTFASLGLIGGGVELRGLAAPVGVAQPQAVPEAGETLLYLLIGILPLCFCGTLTRSRSA